MGSAVGRGSPQPVSVRVPTRQVWGPAPQGRLMPYARSRDVGRRCLIFWCSRKTTGLAARQKSRVERGSNIERAACQRMSLPGLGDVVSHVDGQQRPRVSAKRPASATGSPKFVRGKLRLSRFPGFPVSGPVSRPPAWLSLPRLAGASWRAEWSRKFLQGRGVSGRGGRGAWRT